MRTQTALRSIFPATLASFAVACGGGGAGTTAATTAASRPATTAGGEVVRSVGSGQAVTVTANSRFAEAARAMREHDAANNGRGDWAAATCTSIADQFRDAANAQAGGAFAEAWLDRGLVLLRCNQTEPAREALEHALNVSHDHNFCRARVQLGVLQYRAGQTAPAMATFEQAVHDDPNCVEGYTDLAMMQREHGDADDMTHAVSNIRQALARDDRYVPALNQLALTYLKEAGDDPRSQRLILGGLVCNQAVQLVAQRGDDLAPEVRGFVADIYNTWGLIDIRSGQIIRALDHFRHAYDLNPGLFEAWFNYGLINLSFRGYDDARAALEHAVQLQPNNYDVLIGLGVAQRGQGGADHIREALASYEHARQIDGDRPDVYYDLGVLYQSYMGGEIADFERAIQYLEQFRTKAGATPRYAAAVTRASRYITNLNQLITALRAGGTPAPAPASAPAEGAAATPPVAAPGAVGASPAPSAAPAHAAPTAPASAPSPAATPAAVPTGTGAGTLAH